MADEGAGEKRVTVYPDFSVLTDAAHLEANFIGVADKHDGRLFGVAGGGVQNNAGVAFILMYGPVLELGFFEGGFEYAVRHGRFESDRAGSV